MVAPLNPDAAMEDWPSFCAEGANLRNVVTPSDAEDWQWVDEGSNACPGCHKYGFASKEVGEGLPRVGQAAKWSLEMARLGSSSGRKAQKRRLHRGTAWNAAAF